MIAPIKTWQERMDGRVTAGMMMQMQVTQQCMAAEIADLRAALRAPVQEQGERESEIAADLKTARATIRVMDGTQAALLERIKELQPASERPTAADAVQVPYGWINAGTERQQTEYATLSVGPENPWMDSANAFPVYTAQGLTDAKDAARLDWLAEEECIIEHVFGKYRLMWPRREEQQADLYSTAREAIDAMRPIERMTGNADGEGAK